LPIRLSRIGSGPLFRPITTIYESRNYGDDVLGPCGLKPVGEQPGRGVGTLGWGPKVDKRARFGTDPNRDVAGWRQARRKRGFTTFFGSSVHLGKGTLNVQRQRQRAGVAANSLAET